MISSEIKSRYLAAFANNWCWFLLWGILLLVLGIIAISYTTATTILSVIFLGVLLLLGGIILIVDSFSFWWGKWGGFFWHLIMGILYVIVGILFVKNPLWASVSLTLMLAILFIIVGLFRIIYSSSIRLPRWGWTLFNGIITFILGILIYAQWPVSGLYIIGLFVGIDLIFAGWAYIMISLGARSLMKSHNPKI